MPDLSDFIRNVANDMQTEFASELKVARPLAGLLETTDLAALHANTPAVFISTVGTGKLTLVETGEKDIEVYIIAYVLVVNPDSVDREKTAQQIVARLLDYVPYRRWGFSGAFPAMAVESADLHGLSKGFKPDVTSWRTSVSALSRASDLYGGSDPISHLALWAVTWEQVLRTGSIDSSARERASKQVMSIMNNESVEVYPQKPL